MSTEPRVALTRRLRALGQSVRRASHHRYRSANDVAIHVMLSETTVLAALADRTEGCPVMCGSWAGKERWAASTGPPTRSGECSLKANEDG